MNNKSIYIGFRGLLFLAIFSSYITTGCNDADEERLKQEWIKKEVDKRIEEYKVEKLAECLAAIRIEAEIEVDSILSTKNLFNNVIDESIPTKPTKPEFVPLDSVVLESHTVERVIK